MAVNLFETSTPDQYAGLGAGSAARRRMLAYQMLQKEAGSTDGKVYSNAHGVMKLGAGMLGAALEGWEEKKLAKERQELAKAVLDMSGPIASRVVELRRCAEHGAANA